MPLSERCFLRFTYQNIKKKRNQAKYPVQGDWNSNRHIYACFFWFLLDEIQFWQTGLENSASANPKTTQQGETKQGRVARSLPNRRRAIYVRLWVRYQNVY